MIQERFQITREILNGPPARGVETVDHHTVSRGMGAFVDAERVALSTEIPYCAGGVANGEETAVAGEPDHDFVAVRTDRGAFAAGAAGEDVVGYVCFDGGCAVAIKFFFMLVLSGGAWVGGWWVFFSFASEEEEENLPPLKRCGDALDTVDLAAWNVALAVGHGEADDALAIPFPVCLPADAAAASSAKCLCALVSAVAGASVPDVGHY